jgi:prefoldin subunit 5
MVRGISTLAESVSLLASKIESLSSRLDRLETDMAEIAGKLSIIERILLQKEI